MNKKLFLFFIAIIVSMTMAFVSCGDDDSGNANGGTPTSVLKDKDGNPVRLLSVGDGWYEYDQDGRIVRFGNSKYSYTVTGDTYSEDGSTMSFKFGMNSKGLITSLTMEYDAIDPIYERIKGSGTSSYSYDSNNQLTGITHTYIADIYNGKGTATHEATLTNTWKDGNLVNIALITKDVEPDYNGTIEQNWTISYGSLTNTVRQFPLQLGSDATSITEEAGFGLLSLPGLFGVGPVNLPSGMTTETIEDSKERGQEARHWWSRHNYTFEFTQNSNGTLATEKIDSYTYAYYVYDETRSVSPEQVPMNLLPNIESIIKMFHHKKR